MQNFGPNRIEFFSIHFFREILHVALKNYSKTKMYSSNFWFRASKGYFVKWANVKICLKIVVPLPNQFFSICLLDIPQGYLFVHLTILSLTAKKLRKWASKLLCSKKKFLSFGQNWDLSSFLFWNRVQLRNLF